MKLDDELKGQIEKWNDELKDSSPEEVLVFFLDHFGEEIVLSSSLGLEDQVLTDMLRKQRKNFEVFTLDTGRLFPETYQLIARTNKKYGIRMKLYFPAYEKVEAMVAEKGLNLFRESIENRKLCCDIRKLAQVPRAFEGRKAWFSGLRKDQSVTRFFNKLVEWDELNGMIKINPLIEWTEKQVWAYIREHKVPYNELHDKGYPSIGCEPCTRAIKAGEDVRAGRWWWETPEQKECGLHKR